MDKERFLDFVMLSEDEHQKLVNRFGGELTNKAIEKLNNYIGSTGKKYKSHYFTMLNWVIDSVRDNKRPNMTEQINKLMKESS